ncbi:MAG TPA: hypothetical protein DF383_05775, partial [Deltaproteobacteria bacterium]|nr:hypothetical protein [Deltaproteobacteria bacterium]
MPQNVSKPTEPTGNSFWDLPTPKNKESKPEASKPKAEGVTMLNLGSNYINANEIKRLNDLIKVKKGK